MRARVCGKANVLVCARLCVEMHELVLVGRRDGSSKRNNAYSERLYDFQSHMSKLTAY